MPERLFILFQYLLPHHLLSHIVWPYCAVYGRGGVFVLYFLSTELSGLGLLSSELPGLHFPSRLSVYSRNKSA